MEQSTTQEAPSLALSDLVLLLNLVRAAADRGAIKAEEMGAVGAVHDKLVKFLQASNAIQTQSPNADQPAEQSSEEPQSN